MSDALTYAIELAVGAATLAAGIATWRSDTPRWVSAAFVVAGLAACAHAAAELLT